MNAAVLYSSQTDIWATPPDLFARLNRQYGPFDLDVCALPENAKCVRFFSPEQDGLQQPWVGRCWMNPPYGKTINQWIRKAWESSLEGATVVCLLPARTDTRWWHEFVKPYAKTIGFIRGRVRFGDADHSAPFPSVIVVFAPAEQRRCPWCERPFLPKRTDSKFCGRACKQAAYRARHTTECVTDIAVTTDSAAAGVVRAKA